METTTEMLIRILKDKFDIREELFPDTLIEEIGVDSLDMIHFLFLLYEKTGVEIQDEVLVSDELSTIADLGAYIDKNKKS